MIGSQNSVTNSANGENSHAIFFGFANEIFPPEIHSFSKIFERIFSCENIRMHIHTSAITTRTCPDRAAIFVMGRLTNYARRRILQLKQRVPGITYAGIQRKLREDGIIVNRKSVGSIMPDTGEGKHLN